MLLIEQSHCYLNFYKYKQAKRCIKRALELLELNIKLTGRLGKMTKYQTFDVAQLVLDVSNREVQIIPKPEAPPVEEEKKEGEEPEFKQHVDLEEESILYEQPKITKDESAIPVIKQNGLHIEDQIVLQAYVNYIHKSSPKDEIKNELLRPYIRGVLEKSNNWLVYSQGLLLRSRNDIDKTKLKERSVL
jgi:hypothetical protein